MKLHATWSKMSILGALAFGMGAAVYTGCTVTSGTVDDFDGGSGTTLDSGSPTSDASTGDGGVEGNVGTVCKSAQKSQIIDDTCQLCLEQKCCTQLKGCFDLPASDGVSCDEYGACVDQFKCEVLDPAVDAGSTTCDGCRSGAATGVPAGYNNIVMCAETSCKTECGL
jgi:hypothetical protein